MDCGVELSILIENFPVDFSWDMYHRVSRQDNPINIVNNILGGEFQHWNTKQVWQGEQLYAKLSNGVSFKGKYRRAILMVVKYELTKPQCFPESRDGLEYRYG